MERRIMETTNRILDIHFLIFFLPPASFVPRLPPVLLSSRNTVSDSYRTYPWMEWWYFHSKGDLRLPRNSLHRITDTVKCSTVLPESACRLQLDSASGWNHCFRRYFQSPGWPEDLWCSAWFLLEFHPIYEISSRFPQNKLRSVPLSEGIAIGNPLMLSPDFPPL